MARRMSGGYHDIAAYYEHLIRTGQFKPGERVPTEFELARKHNVTRTTIRRAFDGLVQKGLVTKSQGTGSRVAAAADVEDRARSHVVIALPGSQPDLVIGGKFHRAVNCQDMLYQYVESLVTSLSECGRPFRMHYFVEDPASLDALLAQARQEGAVGVIAVDMHKPACVDHLAASGMPVVFLDCFTGASPVDHVKSDNVSGARDATRHLLRTTPGPAAYFGFVESRTPGSPSRERLDGFLSACREAGREVPEELICAGGPDLRAEAVARMLKMATPPAGYFCCDDDVAVGVIERLRAHGVSVPVQAAVFGFGNLFSGRSVIPAVSTVLVDRKTMGLRAVELLHARLLDPARPPSVVSVPTVIHLRQSTMPDAPAAASGK